MDSETHKRQIKRAINTEEYQELVADVLHAVDKLEEYLTSRKLPINIQFNRSSHVGNPETDVVMDFNFDWARRRC